MNSRTTAALVILLLFVLSIPAAAQYYFGQNKIQYTDFDWQVLTTEHFNIYFYPEEKEIAETAAYLAEESYTYLQEKFNYTVEDHIPFIVYSSPVFFDFISFPFLSSMKICGYPSISGNLDRNSPFIFSLL